MCDNAVRQAMHEVIVNLLSPDLPSRQLAEQQIQALQVTDGKFLALCRFQITPGHPKLVLYLIVGRD